MVGMTFKVITINSYQGTDPDRVGRTIKDQVRKHGVGLVLAQEQRGHDFGDVYRELGFMTTGAGRGGARASWDPDAWPGHCRQRQVRLSHTPWFSEGGDDTPNFTDAAHVTLADELGRSLDAWSFHGAPHIQGKDWPRARKLSTVETLHSLDDEWDDSVADAVLAGCDLNYDPDEGYRDPMIDAALRPFRVMQAPHATLGKTREIDHFLTRPRNAPRALRSVQSWAVPSGGAENPEHWLHGRELAWT